MEVASFPPKGMEWLLCLMNGILFKLNPRLRSKLHQAKKNVALVKNDILTRKFLIRCGKWWLRLMHRDSLVPVRKVLFLRTLARGEDVLIPAYHTFKTTGKALHNPFLANRLSDVELGTWSLMAATLNFLESQIKTIKPRVVLEFGSGVSTACLARYMQELHGEVNRVYVFSIEQDLGVLKKTTQLLRSMQLEEHVRLFHAPLRQQVIEGIQTTCYDLSADFIEPILNEQTTNFVLIDGPAAESGARFGTLPQIRSFLSADTWFFLDDALRDGELKIAHLWSQLPYLKINSIHLRGKGLLIGQVVGDIP